MAYNQSFRVWVGVGVRTSIESELPLPEACWNAVQPVKAI